MKKIITIMAMAAATAFGTAGCSGDLEFNPGTTGGSYVHKMVIDDIPVRPEDWKELWITDRVTGEKWLDRMYCDIKIGELTPSVINGGALQTYFKYTDEDNVYVQEPLPITVYKNESGLLSDWIYTMSCEYSSEWLRITLRTSDFKTYRPGETLWFRTVILY